jgi:hypothetical protein
MVTAQKGSGAAPGIGFVSVHSTPSTIKDSQFDIPHATA